MKTFLDIQLLTTPPNVRSDAKHATHPPKNKWNYFKIGIEKHVIHPPKNKLNYFKIWIEFTAPAVSSKIQILKLTHPKF